MVFQTFACENLDDGIEYVSILLFQHRDVLTDVAADKTAARWIAGLWEPYRAERFYYEVVECGRRIMLTVCKLHEEARGNYRRGASKGYFVPLKDLAS